MNQRFRKCQFLCICALLFLRLDSADAQLPADCRPAPPMPPKVKPGVNNIVFTKDGKVMVVANGDGKIRFVDVDTGKVQRTLIGHTNAVYVAILSPDEKLLASSSRDQTARLWDVATGRELHQFGGFQCTVKTVAFSPNGRSLAVSGNDGIVKLWDVATGKESISFGRVDSDNRRVSVYCVTFDRTGKKIYTANDDGTISEWDIAKAKETRVFKAHDGATFQIRFNRDYSLLASSGYDGLVKLWDTSNWHEVRSMSMARPSAPATIPSEGLTFSHDGKLLAAGNAGMNQDRSAYMYVQAMVWNVATGEKLWTFEGHKFDINALTFTNDDKLLLTGSVDQTIKFRDLKTGSETRTLTMTSN